MPSAESEFLADPDQESRRLELRRFFGPGADVYLKVYDGMREGSILATGGHPRLRFFAGGFSGAAFLVGPVWFFYRKMWAWAWGIVLAFGAIGIIPGQIGNRLGLPLAFALALAGKRIYVQHAIRRVQRLRQHNGDVLTASEIERAGGVSVMAGTVSAVIFGLLVILTIAGLVLALRGGLPPAIPPKL